ncbi:hypothetical protein GCM10027599_26540 [Yimella radicis]
MGSIVSAWVHFCTHLQGAALLAVLGSLICCALRIHFLTHRTRPEVEQQPAAAPEVGGWAA